MKFILPTCLLVTTPLLPLTAADVAPCPNCTPCSDDTPAATPAPEAPAAEPSPCTPAAPQVDMVELVKEAMLVTEDLTSVFASVTDKASADAAAEKLPALSEKMKAITAQAEGMQEPQIQGNPELEALEARHEATTRRLGEALMQLAMKNFYGSEALVQALDAM